MSLLKRVFSFPRKHKKITIVGVIILLIVGWVLRPKPSIRPETTTVTYNNLVQSVAVSGSIDAKKTASVSFLTSGTVVYVGAQKGDSVKLGQTLAQLDARTVLKNLQTSLLTYSEQRNTFDQTIENNKDNPLTNAVSRVLANNQYDLQKSVVSVELQDLARQQSFLTAPFDGILTRADIVTTGSTATPTNVFTVTDPTSLVFAMDVDEADIGKISLNQTVSINLDAYPTETLNLPINNIDFVTHTTNNGGNAYTVEVALPVTSKYRVGIQGNAEIITAKKSHVLTVPIASIFDDTSVYVALPKGYQKRRISLGLENDIDAEVVSGLSEGDKVVLDPTKVAPKDVVK